ncbi:NADPH-dependent F420 reductase [Marinomonas mediterranea]|jgi:Predicted dinucleotide-binding enzymes|uniref:NADP oxidoreductase coenzyme F420-dependent n=1 Tax=Marinomonas mediterranea (strain ATCC 700492 / JCM 21426 / NBRC 103028 / MMB-1) TaxID=717774 RepID=F2K1P0_MARM1|nr:NAD(P)-binding domain-containing protein [Marinomonas mediterranea]ADZ93374.1 NADP oxidoreductase coenzyme F420-dependent [Marinomonas mediterranea MMB-1]WCN11262.1 NAD(P)-binding domain-containing protein [Marinomonas mediterranea]WCN19370.1 NAD(P)-binding domain-containing protein [Marinomonas mediterranea MMB-1]
MNIGIIGAGPMGQVLTQHAINAGHKVMLSNSRSADSLTRVADALLCDVGSAEQASEFGEIVIIAVPLHAYDKLPKASLKGKIVVDLLNYFPNRDGAIPDLLNEKTTTSEMLSSFLDGAIVVKAFNSITVQDLAHDARPGPSDQERRAIPVASDDPQAKTKIMNLIEAFGFDSVDAGVLSDSWKFERYRPVYCCSLHKETMESLLASTTRETKVRDGHWIQNRQALA